MSMWKMGRLFSHKLEINYLSREKTRLFFLLCVINFWSMWFRLGVAWYCCWTLHHQSSVVANKNSSMKDSHHSIIEEACRMKWNFTIWLGLNNPEFSSVDHVCTLVNKLSTSYWVIVQNATEVAHWWCYTGEII